MKKFHHVDRKDPEWQRMWDALANAAVNRGLENAKSYFMYMGTVEENGYFAHSFKCREHPVTNKREDLQLGAGINWRPGK